MEMSLVRVGEGLQTFRFGDQEIRVVMIDGEPWFVAKDACDVMGIANHRDAVGRLPETWRDDVGISDAMGRNQETTVISESALYKLAFRSNKPEAEQFSEWVARDVLPSIRKHGMYATPALLNDPEHLLRVTQRLVEEHRGRLAAEAQLLEQKPLVAFAETCISSKDSVLVRELAKVASKQGVVTGEKRLYERLRDWGLILRGKTEPSQKAMDSGYFEVIQRPVDTPYGTHLRTTTKVTPRGQVHIIERLKAGG